MTCVHKRAVMSQKNHRADSHNCARTESVRQKQSIKKKKKCVCLTLLQSKTQPPLYLPRIRNRCPHVVAFRRDMEKGEPRPLPTLTGRQQQPSALAKHSRQPFLCPFGDTSPQPLSSPGLWVMQVTWRYNFNFIIPPDEIESF